MLIEIRKAGFINKGAQMMLLAVQERLDRVLPDARIALAPELVSAPYARRAESGFLQKATYWRKGLQLGALASLLPADARKMYGIVLDREVDVVLDIAGFGYSDQIGRGGCIELAQRCLSARKGSKIVLLPQALGPFHKASSRAAMATVARRADLIFARDQQSYDFMVEAAGARDNIRMAPDFTNLLAPDFTKRSDIPAAGICIVASAKLVEKTSPEAGLRYRRYLVEATRRLQAAGERPFFLVHEGVRDRKLAQDVVAETGIDLPVIVEDDPLKLKGILGSCRGTIGGRYHGLVSSLSQSVPSIGMGWSHKYRLLFEDYEFPEGLLSLDEPDDQAFGKLELLTDESRRTAVIQKLSTNSVRIKADVEAMWASVEEVILR